MLGTKYAITMLLNSVHYCIISNRPSQYNTLDLQKIDSYPPERLRMEPSTKVSTLISTPFIVIISTLRHLGYELY